MKDKVNVVSWKGEEQPGFRANWLNLTLAVLLMVAVAFATHLRDEDHALYSGWSLASIIFIVFLSGIIAMLVSFSRVEGERWPVVCAFFLGMVVMALCFCLLLITHVSWTAAGLGLVTFVVIGFCLAGITLTRWWPDRRASRNRR